MRDLLYFTAPNVRPWTNCRWLNQPNTRIGATAIVDAADSLAKNKPSGLENDAMNAVKGAAPADVRFRLQNASFQHRISDSRPVEATPGNVSGSSRYQTSPAVFAPSMRPASRISFGTSL